MFENTVFVLMQTHYPFHSQEKNSSTARADAKMLEKLVSALFDDEDMMAPVSPEYIQLVAQAMYRLSQNAANDNEVRAASNVSDLA